MYTSYNFPGFSQISSIRMKKLTNLCKKCCKKKPITANVPVCNQDYVKNLWTSCWLQHFLMDLEKTIVLQKFRNQGQFLHIHAYPFDCCNTDHYCKSFLNPRTSTPSSNLVTSRLWILNNLEKQFTRQHLLILFQDNKTAETDFMKGSREHCSLLKMQVHGFSSH